jgi:hypothetical protein
MKLKEIGNLTGKDIFGLVIRLIGLMFLYQGLMAVPQAFAGMFPLFPHLFIRNVVPGIVMVGWPLAAAYWLVRGAPPLMRWAYPEEKRLPAAPVAEESYRP